ncbi:Hsp20 family protein [Methyloligella sp. GL2]|nr:Hsp20 family protein [Methyloligella sp. GL2]
MVLLNGAVWLGQGNSQGSQNGAGRSKPDGYPPFNVELLNPGADEAQLLRITLAVAGFKREQLEVTVGHGELVIQGAQGEDDAGRDRDYLHRGIAARQFKRSFGLAEDVEVCKAELDHGLLTIELRRLRKADPVRKVGIVATGGGNHGPRAPQRPSHEE